jgi:hypothetical protein
MRGVRDFQVEELVCLHRQMRLWVTCPHRPAHQDLAEAMIHASETRDPETRRLVRAATAGRRGDPGERGAV